MKNLIAILTFSLLSTSTSTSAFAATAPVAAEPCPAPKLCPTLLNQAVSCKKWYSEKTCDSFVETYEKLSAKYDCKRTADAKAVPAVMLCDDKGMDNQEKVATLLYKLKFQKARQFFASEEFRSTLEGELADSFMKKSKHAAENQKK